MHHNERIEQQSKGHGDRAPDHGSVPDIESGAGVFRLQGSEWIRRKCHSPIGIASRIAPRVVPAQVVMATDPGIYVGKNLLLQKAPIGFVDVNVSSWKRAQSGFQPWSV